MSRPKTWRVLRWDGGPKDLDSLPVVELWCDCGQEAYVPISSEPESPIIARIGRGLIFDDPGYRPPKGWLPTEIQCRRCRRIFTNDGGTDVR
jgi:hypothetical protein